MKSFEAIVVRVSRPFAYNKDGMVNSCIKMLVDVKCRQKGSDFHSGKGIFELFFYASQPDG